MSIPIASNGNRERGTTIIRRFDTSSTPSAQDEPDRHATLGSASSEMPPPALNHVDVQSRQDIGTDRILLDGSRR